MKELDSRLFHAGFGETRFLKWCDVINSNSWFFRRFAFTVFKLTFFSGIKKDFDKNRYFMCQMVTSGSLPHTCVNLMQTVGRFNMWVTSKTNRPNFYLILKLSHALDGLFVSSRPVGCMLVNISVFFSWMKHHWTWCDYFQILLLGILSSMEPNIYFQMHCFVWWLYWVLLFT